MAGKAKAPHDTSRPTPRGVMKALEARDIEMLRLKLTPKQRAFCHEYVVDHDATAAVLRAGYETAHPGKQGYLLKMNKGVQAYIDHLKMSVEAKIVSVSPDYLLARLNEIMNAEGGRDSDKLRAIEMYMKHLGMFIERQEITGKDGGAIEVEQRKIQQEADGFLAQIQSMAERANKDKPSVN